MSFVLYKVGRDPQLHLKRRNFRRNWRYKLSARLQSYISAVSNSAADEEHEWLMEPTFLPCFMKPDSVFPARPLFSHHLPPSLSPGWRRFQRAVTTGSRAGTLCTCPPSLAPGCTWQICPPTRTTSSASCPRTEWGRDLSARSSPLGPWVSTRPSGTLDGFSLLSWLTFITSMWILYVDRVRLNACEVRNEWIKAGHWLHRKKKRFGIKKNTLVAALL